MEKIFKPVDTVIGWIEDIACVVTLATIVVIVTVSVFARYMFHTGFLWADEVNQALMVAMGMFGCARAIRCNGHTELTSLISKPSSKSVRIALRAIIAVLALITLAILFYSSFQYTLDGTVKSVALRIPRMYYYAPMPIGFGLSLYEFLRAMKNKILLDPPPEY